MIIYINGPIHSGKTTVCKALVSRLPDCIHIEVDDLRNFASDLPLEDAIPYALEDALLLAQNWIKRKCTVLLSWPISVYNFSRVISLAENLQSPLHAFTLLPQMEVCLSQRGNRILTDWEIKRIPEMYEELFMGDTIGKTIDNSTWTVEQTVHFILDSIV